MQSLQIVLQAQLAKERRRFDINDVVKGINKKLKRRHPHVFGKKKVRSVKEIIYNWHEIKRKEKEDKRKKKKHR